MRVRMRYDYDYAYIDVMLCCTGFYTISDKR